MICDLCKKEMDFHKGKISSVEDYDNGISVGKIWCHRECFKKGMNRDLTDLEKQAKGILDQAPKILGMLGIKEQPKEYVIK